ALIISPADCRPVIALSRPEPGPLTRTSISLTPNFAALSAHVSAARCAAKGVLLRLPLKPDVPAVAQHNTSPFRSVMVTVVLLKVALMWATARATLRRIFFRTTLLTPLLLIESTSSLPHLFDALLPGNRFADSLPRACVRPRPLAADRQAATMPQSPVGADVAQPGNILLNLAPELPFDHVFLVEQVGNARQIVIRQLFGRTLQIDPQRPADANGCRPADSV